MTIGKSGILVALLLLACPGHAQLSLEHGFSYYIGGSGYEQVRDVATDCYGNIYITGGTSSGNFKTTTGRKLNACGQKIMDVFVMKFSPSGELIWSTLLGGEEYDRAYAIEADENGNVYVAGRAGNNLPVTKCAFQPEFGGDNDPNALYGEQDGFIAKFNTNGELLWCSYFGGSDRGFIRDLAIDNESNIYIVETETSAPNPHISNSAFQKANNGRYDAVVAKISSDGKLVLWATYLGGSENDMYGPSIKVDRKGRAVVVGTVYSEDMPVTKGCIDSTWSGNADIFLAKFSPNGEKLLLGTYIGGSGEEGTETHNLALDAYDNIIIGASTSTPDFITTANALQKEYGGDGNYGLGKNTNYPFDGFIMKLTADGDSVIASTYFGGKNGEAIEGIDADEGGNIYITGATFSSDLPGKNEPAYQKENKGMADAFLGCLTSDLSKLEYFSYIGGTDKDYGRTLCVEREGNICIAGETASDNFNVTDGGYSGGSLDGFLTGFKTLNRVKELIPCKPQVEIRNPCQ